MYVPPGTGEVLLRGKIMRYVQLAARRGAEAGELVAVGSDFNPGTSHFPGCSGVGPCQAVPATPEGRTRAPGTGMGRVTDYLFSSKGQACWTQYVRETAHKLHMEWDCK